jgi:oxaloacetate decarboxylase beta subunit
MKQTYKYLGILAVLALVATPLMAADFSMADKLENFFSEMGIVSFFVGEGWKNAIMIAVGCLLLYLAIQKKYEPLLLLPIAFGMILTNLPGAGLFHTEMWNNEFLNPESPFYHSYRHVMA